jgi:hypothetical protein
VKHKKETEKRPVTFIGGKSIHTAKSLGAKTPKIDTAVALQQTW